MTGYIRQDVSNNIANGNVIDAEDFDNEFDAIASAFNTSTGHTHDGSSAEGAPITVVGPAQDIVVSATAVTPKTDDAYDLGSPTNQWKDLHIDGTANIDTLVADAGTVAGAAITTLSNTQTLTNKTLNLGNNTLVATSAQLAAALTDETGTGSVVFSASPALTGTPTAPTAAAGTNTTQVATTAHVFAERTNTATLTNKTLTSSTINTPTISGGSISGITDLSIADGGTGASTAPQALINLGLTATAAEINTLDGFTGNVGQLNRLTEILNILDNSILMWKKSLAEIPLGWQLCDGSNGTLDLRDKFVVGASSTYAVGATGGAAAVSLTEANLPEHAHTFSGTTSTSGTHNHESFGGAGINGGRYGFIETGILVNNVSFEPGLDGRAHLTREAGAHTHMFSGTTSSIGSGAAHNNLPPYYALCFIQKV